GNLSGSLDQEGSGSVTLALTNSPPISSIVANNGTLVYNSPTTNTTTVASVFSDDGNGFGTIAQAGSNIVKLTANNLNYSGSILVTNGVLQYTTAQSLGQAFATLTV